METSTRSAKTRENLVKDLGQLKQDAVKVQHDVRNYATARVDDVKQQVKNTTHDFHAAITSHPLSLLGIGFAVGFLFGLRFNR